MSKVKFKDSSFSPSWHSKSPHWGRGYPLKPLAVEYIRGIYDLSIWLYESHFSHSKFEKFCLFRPTTFLTSRWRQSEDLLSNAQMWHDTYTQLYWKSFEVGNLDNLGINRAILERTVKLWNLLFRTYWLLLEKFYLSKEDWTLWLQSNLMFSLTFPIFLRFKVFSRLATRKVTRAQNFFILDIKFCFTLGQSKTLQSSKILRPRLQSKWYLLSLYIILYQTLRFNWWKIVKTRKNMHEKYS